MADSLSKNDGLARASAAAAEDTAAAGVAPAETDGPPARANPAAKYKAVRQIGKGTFGTALLVEAPATGKKYVMKRIRLARMTRQQRDAALLEMSLLSKLEHPNILEYKEAWVESGHTINIVTQYCSRGDLLTLLRKWRGPPPDEAFVVEVLVQLTAALSYVHGHDVLHRDVKSSNVFLTHRGLVQLGDFGLAARVGPLDNDTVPGTMVGTPNYMAPEVISEKPHGRPCDVWSLGCVTYEMMALRPAFAAFDLDGLIRKVKSASAPKVPERFSNELKTTVHKMLSKRATDRPTCQSMLEDNWLKQYVPGVKEKVTGLSSPMRTSRLPPIHVTASAARDGRARASTHARRGPGAAGNIVAPGYVQATATAQVAAAVPTRRGLYQYGFRNGTEPPKHGKKLAPIESGGRLRAGTDPAMQAGETQAFHGKKRGVVLNPIEKATRRRRGDGDMPVPTALKMYRPPVRKAKLEPMAPDLATLKRMDVPTLENDGAAEFKKVLNGARKRVLSGRRPLVKKLTPDARRGYGATPEPDQ